MIKPIAFMGIDPGKTGAAALLYEPDEGQQGVDIIDWSDPVQVAADVSEWVHDFKIVMAVLEKVHSMPKQGVSGVFTFGTNYGVWQGILSALKVPHVLVTPQKWQKGALSKGDGKNTKERSLAAVRRLYPGSRLYKRKMDDGRADATLMAHHALAVYSGVNGAWKRFNNEAEQAVKSAEEAGI